MSLIYSLVGSLDVKQNFVFRLVDISRAYTSLRDREEGVYPIAEEDPGSQEKDICWWDT